MSPVNGLTCGSGEQRRRWCSQADCSAVRTNRVGQGDMALPKGWGNPTWGFTLRALGKARWQRHPAPPSWAFCFLLSSRHPFTSQLAGGGRTAALIKLKNNFLEH